MYLGAVQKWRKHPVLGARACQPLDQNGPYFRPWAPPTNIEASAFFHFLPLADVIFGWPLMMFYYISFCALYQSCKSFIGWSIETVINLYSTVAMIKSRYMSCMALLNRGAEKYADGECLRLLQLMINKNQLTACGFALSSFVFLSSGWRGRGRRRRLCTDDATGRSSNVHLIVLHEKE